LGGNRVESEPAQVVALFGQQESTATDPEGRLDT
jgi:hypothetical protein